MARLRYVAFISVARAVAFSGLGIFMVMVGLSYEPVLALRSGGVLLLILLAGLLLKAQRAPLADPRRTEAWMLLDRSERPSDPAVARVMTGALRDACLWFARWTACLAALVWGCALLVSWFGVNSIYTSA